LAPGAGGVALEQWSPAGLGTQARAAIVESTEPAHRDGSGAEGAEPIEGLAEASGCALQSGAEACGCGALEGSESATISAGCVACEGEAAPSSGLAPGGAEADAVAEGGGGTVTRRRLRRGERSLLTRTAWARWLQNWWRRVLWMRAAVGKADAPWQPGDWRRCAPWRRLRTQPRCLSGAGLASDRELDDQAARARGVTMWYSQYVRILKRLTKRTPTALSGFCGGGGSDEGVRRCGGTSVGFDKVDQPN